AYENGKYVRDHQTGWYYTEQAYENADPFGNLILSDIVVPVELYSFEAFVTDDRVQLKWQTASESSNYGFEVQRSNNGIHFEKIGFVPGAGTTSSPQGYAFDDEQNSRAVCYYRLKIFDYDGNHSFSSIVQVNLSQPTKFHLYANYPNPFNPETTIKYDLADAKLVVIKIYNLSGKEITTLVNERQKPGSYALVWRTQNVPSGIYLCRMEAGSYRESFKLTILK
ncbi:MAG: T9SS type A sorting domain-containing protein, partial [bacterium]|nr:T9SS type A sorting domain-containing protein [bacterium]